MNLGVAAFLVCLWGVKASSNEYRKCNNEDCSGKAACVTIFQHRNFGGWFQCITLKNAECVPLNDWWVNAGSRVSGADTHGTCVRLHEHRDCTGFSIEVKPGSLHHKYFNELNFEDEAQSVSSCARPTHYHDCQVKVLFSPNIPTEQVAEASSKVLDVFSGITGVMVSAVAISIPVVNVVYTAFNFFMDLFNPRISSEALVNANIIKAFDRESAIKISAKMNTIVNRLESALNSCSPDDKRAEILIAINECEKLHFMFANGQFIFSRNRLASSPFLVSFSTTYLSVAKMQYYLRPERQNVLRRQMSELARLNERYCKEAIKQRRELFTWDRANLVTGSLSNIKHYGRQISYVIQDKLVCPNRVSDGPREQCFSYKGCLNWHRCERCQKNINADIEIKVRKFFQPIINALKRFPN